MGQLKAGSVADFADSMAAAMEEAFKAEWPNAMSDAPVPESNPQMRLMFVAIARGVINHIQTNKDAFEVTVNNGKDTYKGTITKIDTDPV